MEVQTKSKDETQNLAGKIALAIKPAGENQAIIIGLVGDLGSGKTTFTQGFLSAFGLQEPVTSPTFILEKIYPLVGHQFFERVIHCDLYRLEAETELTGLNFDAIFNNPKNLVIIEWPEKFASLTKKLWTTINFTFIDENTRQIKYDEKLL